MARVIASPAGSSAVPVHVWSREAPPAAVAQLERIAAQPYVVGHVAGMPDLHVSHGVAVGTVFATDGVLVPSTLGGDLGCGVAAVQLDVTARALDRHALQRILAGWAARIPVGDAVHRGGGAPVPEELLDLPLSTHALEHVRDRLPRRHLGTLGGGNHFVELDRDMDGGTWLLVHTGSRGLGSAIGAHHLRAAAASGHGDSPGLPVDSVAGRAFLEDLGWALAFAAAKAATTSQDMLTTEKVMQTFRMPRELVAALRAEAERKGLDLTALVVKLAHGYLTDHGLPEAATSLLDEDRAALRMDRDAYLLHLLFQRSLQVREQGAGYDAPRREREGR